MVSNHKDILNQPPTAWSVSQILTQRMVFLQSVGERIAAFNKTAPEGSLRINRNHDTNQYYFRKDSSDKNGSYIRKDNTLLIKTLAQKEYIQKLYPNLNKEMKYIKILLSLLEQDGMINVFDRLQRGTEELIEPYLLTTNAFVSQWISHFESLKEKNKSYIFPFEQEDEDGIITEKGERVRSKSEKILADKLYMMNIPYVYEVPILLNGIGYVNPDFVVLNCRTRQTFYWEHLGMMTKPEYCIKNIHKIENYEKCGIFPGKKLLLTFETEEHPLQTKIVEKTITEYLT